MAPEPLSKLRPPDSTDAAVPTSNEGGGSGGRGRLEWVVTDLNLAVMSHTEVFLPAFWQRMHEDGTFKMFFHEGPDMTFWQFVSILSNPLSKVQLVMGHDTDGTAKEHAGLLILDHILYTDKVKRATGNFMFFHEYWNRHDTSDIARAVLNNWFGVWDADTIGGVTPRANRAAVAFIKRIGFQVIGDIPMFTTYEGEPSASTFSYMTRDMWRKRYQPDAQETAKPEA